MTCDDRLLELVEVWRDQAEAYPSHRVGVTARAAVESCADELETLVATGKLPTETDHDNP